jgi:TP901 family phage tail tape measure protein
MSRFSVEAIFNAKDKMTPVIKNMGAKIDKFAMRAKKGLGELDEINSKLVGGINKVATALTGAAVAAGAGLAAAAKPGMEFEQQMADLGASFLKTRGEIGGLEREALKLGAATKFSATEVAGAMEAMSKAGFDEQQTLEGIAGMTYAAAAAGEGLIETTETISAVMKGMQIDVAYSTQAADILALASVKTASSIGSLGESLSKAGPVAKQFGIGLTDVTAMVASLQDAGIDASEAGSAVATMLTKMATPTDAMRAKMKQLGVSFEDSAGNMKAPADVLEQLVKGSKKAGGNMKQAAFFAELLGLRGQKAGLLLKSALASGKYDKLVSSLREAEGTAKKMADLRMNTLTGDIDVFTENVKGLGIELFSLNSGPLRDVVKGMTEWLDANKVEILNEIQNGVEWFKENLPAIVDWTKRLAIAWAVFNTISVGIKAAQMAIALYELTVMSAKAATEAFTWATKQSTKSLTSMSGALNASKLGGQINGITSKLGAAGLLGAAGAVGYAFGSWLNETFGLDEKISGWMAGLTGVEDKLNQMGGRAEKPGLDPEGDMHLSDGSVQRANGTWKFKSDARMAKENAAAKLAVFNKTRPAVPGSDSFADMYRDPDADAARTFTPQIVSPADMIARSISEHTETTKAEVTIKDESGAAAVTKQPAGKGFSIRLSPTGAF